MASSTASLSLGAGVEIDISARPDVDHAGLGLVQLDRQQVVAAAATASADDTMPPVGHRGASHREVPVRARPHRLGLPTTHLVRNH